MQSGPPKPSRLGGPLSVLPAESPPRRAFAGREDLAGLLADEILALRSVCGHLVVVTNNVFNDGGDYDGETVRYMEILADVNRRLAAAADAAVEVIFGIPVKIK